MTKEDRNRYLEVLESRLLAVKLLEVGLDLIGGQHKAPKRFICEDFNISFSHRVLSTAFIENGIVSARVLLNFLGLKADRTKQSLVAMPRHKAKAGTINDDIVIEDFDSLHSISPEDATQRYPDASEAEKALVLVIASADKYVAHLTQWLPRDPRTIERLRLASRGVVALMTHLFYTPLKMRTPEWSTSGFDLS